MEIPDGFEVFQFDAELEDIDVQCPPSTIPNPRQIGNR